MRSILLISALVYSMSGFAAEKSEWLVKFNNKQSIQTFSQQSSSFVKDLNFANWVKVSLTDQQAQQLKNHSNVVSLEKNQIFKIQTDFEIHDPATRKMIADRIVADGLGGLFGPEAEDNPDIPLQGSGGSGSDPEFGNQWGMADIGVKEAWANSGTKGDREVVVAVIDTGVDYTHEDLVDNMWHNPGETGTDANGRPKATNGIDDDNNGFIDDVVGWDFATEGGDNKPYDLAKRGFELLFGGNPGHGTHCAGNVAARADNGKGIAGVAPNVKIMAMRFLTENGQGTTEGAINSIKYAVDNGAQILSNSWGSEGDGGDQQASQALQDAIQYALDKNVLFVAAAGNGHQGVGYDNDTDDRPAYPASYDHENIISVAALDVNDALGSFSNWGRKTVDIGAPGVKVFSTVPGNGYEDTLNLIIAQPTWDGTSMATPHVAGAAALYLSKHPEADWRDLKNAVLNSVTPINAMSGKSTSGGKLNVKKLMEM